MESGTPGLGLVVAGLKDCAPGDLFVTLSRNLETNPRLRDLVCKSGEDCCKYIKQSAVVMASFHTSVSAAVPSGLSSKLTICGQIVLA
jgi:hypothetical protein